MSEPLYCEYFEHSLSYFFNVIVSRRRSSSHLWMQLRIFIMDCCNLSGTFVKSSTIVLRGLLN